MIGLCQIVIDWHAPTCILLKCGTANWICIWHMWVDLNNLYVDWCEYDTICLMWFNCVHVGCVKHCKCDLMYIRYKLCDFNVRCGWFSVIVTCVMWFKCCTCYVIVMRHTMTQLKVVHVIVDAFETYWCIQMWQHVFA